MHVVRACQVKRLVCVFVAGAVAVAIAVAGAACASPACCLPTSNCLLDPQTRRLAYPTISIYITQFVCGTDGGKARWEGGIFIVFIQYVVQNKRYGTCSAGDIGRVSRRVICGLQRLKMYMYTSRCECEAQVRRHWPMLRYVCRHTPAA